DSGIEIVALPALLVLRKSRLPCRTATLALPAEAELVNVNVLPMNSVKVGALAELLTIPLPLRVSDWGEQTKQAGGCSCRVNEYAGAPALNCSVPTLVASDEKVSDVLVEAPKKAGP